jgi:dTDP-glucose pyrophosphorylase/CBS domain-containing protein
MNRHIADFSFLPENSIREVIACINRSDCGIGLMTDSSGRLLATITDGDVRRAILDGRELDESGETLLLYKAARHQTPTTAHRESSPAMMLQLMKEHDVLQLPLLDDDGRVVDMVTREDLRPSGTLSLQAVIMAGGKGTRLRPLTEDMPKPMLPVGNRPIMEHIIDQMREAGIQRVNITTHYQPEKISNYFGDGHNFGVELNYVAEDRPLGTAGALGLMEPTAEPLLVINGDILTQVDFRAMLAFHREHQADLTVGVRRYDFQIPYGVVESEGVFVKQLKEKPAMKFLVNAGIYLLEPSAISSIPRNQHFDMTDLIEMLIAEGRPVASFPIVEYWLDIGRHADYEQAQEDIKAMTQKGQP